MLFKNRMKLADEYIKWIEENPPILDCPASVIAFLDLKGLLKDEKEEKKIKTQIDRKKWHGDIFYIVWVYDSHDNIIGFQKFYEYLDAFTYTEYMKNQKSPE